MLRSFNLQARKITYLSAVMDLALSMVLQYLLITAITCLAFNSTCDHEMFQCASDGRCIPHMYYCDKDNDCLDGSDEPDNCTEIQDNSTCNHGMFQCAYTGTCIPHMYYCDKDKDCLDGSDEPDNCTEKQVNSTCDHGMFMCASDGTCIPHKYYCDKDKDCLDGSDEPDDCTEKQANRTCSVEEFSCATYRKCIPYKYYCDKQMDCRDWSDEPANCYKDDCSEYYTRCIGFGRSNSTCQKKIFQCALSKTCIPYRWYCDKEMDCPDGSDEPDTCHELQLLQPSFIISIGVGSTLILVGGTLLCCFIRKRNKCKKMRKKDYENAQNVETDQAGHDYMLRHPT